MTFAPIKPASHATGPLFRRTRLLIVSMVVFAAAALAAIGLLTLQELDALIAHQRDVAEALTADARRSLAETRLALLAVSAMALPLIGLFAWVILDISARVRAMEAERLEAERQAARGHTEQLLAAYDELAAMVQLLTAQKSELQEAYEAQSRMSAIKDEFLSVVSHELRTPLAAIKSAAAILSKGKAGPLTEDQRRFTTMIREQVERLHRLVDDTLDVSQLENGTMAFRFERQDLRPLVAEIAGAYQHLLEHEGLSLTLSLGEAPLPISLDRDRMTQVLLNLLSNAAKFTSPPGQVAVRLVREEGSAVIRVSDTGLGVAQADLERIFEKFTQAEVSLTRRAGGAGLGLAIARDLVEAHGGTIGVESEPGSGSTFWVRLPIAA